MITHPISAGTEAGRFANTSLENAFANFKIGALVSTTAGRVGKIPHGAGRQIISAGGMPGSLLACAGGGENAP